MAGTAHLLGYWSGSRWSTHRENEMAQKEANNVMSEIMVSLTIGYTDYVLPAEDALAVVKLLNKAQIYERKLNPERSKDNDSDVDDYLHYVYDQPRRKVVSTMHYLPEDLYRMAKLAGKP